ncbi:hypothetical protein PAHAL_5G039000 [Panicum hallii]|uniref:Uncharacterized protein n=1 Tax=Panicum hallii TaxID=206008 RepID=A0A2T8IIV0_9POAL|nr:hypothetical protein PAHAL_5G039000 [Panicum hallii]
MHFRGLSGEYWDPLLPFLSPAANPDVHGEPAEASAAPLFQKDNPLRSFASSGGGRQRLHARGHQREAALQRRTPPRRVRRRNRASRCTRGSAWIDAAVLNS